MDVVEKPLHVSGEWPALSLKRAAGGGTKKGKKRSGKAASNPKAKAAKTAKRQAKTGNSGRTNKTHRSRKAA